MQIIKSYPRSVFLGITVAMFFTILAIVNVGTAEANPLQFVPPVQTATATTSLSYIGVGTATTTLQFDSFLNGQTKAVDKAALLIQFTGSSTSSVLKLSLEYSQDGIDWYQDNLLAGDVSTTTPSVTIVTPTSYTWKFDQSTVGGAGGTTTVTNKIITVPIATRYIRTVSSLTGAAGAIWQQIIPVRQMN